MPVYRLLAALLGLALLAACEPSLQVTSPKRDLGDFSLGFAVVATTNMKMVPISRRAEAAEWEAALKRAVEDRFGRYDGDKLYNIGVAVDGFALAPPGVPVVLKPKSILVVSAVIFDDATGAQLNEKGFQITGFERGSTDTFIGSGITRTRQEQMDELAYVAAERMEQWLYDNRDWFGVAVKRKREPPPPTVVSKP